MISLKAEKMRFFLLTGKITTDSYSATIKKLTLAQEAGFAQIAPARRIAGKRHLQAALEHSASAFESKSNFAKTISLEFLIRLFGEKQLGKVLAAAEFRDGEEIVLVGVGGAKKAAALKKEFGISETKFKFGKNRRELMEFYGITQSELDAVSDLKNALEELVVENISFVALER